MGTRQFRKWRCNCQPILDELALAVRLAYVVLNLARMGAAKTSQSAPAKPARDQWLGPLSLSVKIAGARTAAGRDSNTGCLAMTLDDHLRLVDWTSQQARRGKRGVIPADVSLVLDRLQISAESWLELIADFSRLFRRAAGRPESLRRDAQKWREAHRRDCEQPGAVGVMPGFA